MQIHTLHKRCKQSQYSLKGHGDKRNLFRSVFFMDLLADFKCIEKVLLKICYGFRIIYICSTFEMQIETSIIHIDSSHYSNLVITDITFCMYKSGCIVIYPHSCLQKLWIVGLCEHVHYLLIRYPGVTILISTPDFAARHSASIISLSIMR